MVIYLEENRRQYFRVILSQKTVLKALMLNDKTLQITSQRELPGEIVDLSGGGACAMTDVEIGDDELLEFSFTLNREVHIVMGRVMWSRQEEAGRYRFGIKFEGLDDDERSKIIKGLNDEIIRRRKT